MFICYFPGLQCETEKPDCETNLWFSIIFNYLGVSSVIGFHIFHISLYTLFSLHLKSEGLNDHLNDGLK